MDFLPSNATDLAKTLGIAVLLFFSVLVVGGLMISYMRIETRKWEDREKHATVVYQSIIKRVAESQEKEYHLLKATLDDNRDQISINRGLVERIKTMQRDHETSMRDIFDKLSRILEDRCRHHLINTPKPKQS